VEKEEVKEEHKMTRVMIWDERAAAVEEKINEKTGPRIHFSRTCHAHAHCVFIFLLLLLLVT
jgi:hypothetical protein